MPLTRMTDGGSSNRTATQASVATSMAKAREEEERRRREAQLAFEQAEKKRQQDEEAAKAYSSPEEEEKRRRDEEKRRRDEANKIVPKAQTAGLKTPPRVAEPVKSAVKLPDNEIKANYEAKNTLKDKRAEFPPLKLRQPKYSDFVSKVQWAYGKQQKDNWMTEHQRGMFDTQKQEAAKAYSSPEEFGINMSFFATQAEKDAVSDALNGKLTADGVIDSYVNTYKAFIESPKYAEASVFASGENVDAARTRKYITAADSWKKYLAASDADKPRLREETVSLLRDSFQFAAMGPDAPTGAGVPLHPAVEGELQRYSDSLNDPMMLAAFEDGYSFDAQRLGESESMLKTADGMRRLVAIHENSNEIVKPVMLPEDKNEFVGELINNQENLKANYAYDLHKFMVNKGLKLDSLVTEDLDDDGQKLTWGQELANIDANLQANIDNARAILAEPDRRVNGISVHKATQSFLDDQIRDQARVKGVLLQSMDKDAYDKQVEDGYAKYLADNGTDFMSESEKTMNAAFVAQQEIMSVFGIKTEMPYGKSIWGLKERPGSNNGKMGVLEAFSYDSDSEWSELDADERLAFFALYAEDPELAKGYMRSMQNTVDYRKTQRVAALGEASGREHILRSFFENPMFAILARYRSGLSTIGEGGKAEDDKRPFHEGNLANIAYGAQSSGMTDEAIKKLGIEDKPFLREALKVGMTVIPNFVNNTLVGMPLRTAFGGVGGLVAYSTQSFGPSYYEAINTQLESVMLRAESSGNPISLDEAIAQLDYTKASMTAWGDVAAEVITEALPLEKLAKGKSGAAILSELFGEGGSDALSQTFDNVINGKDSVTNLRINDYVFKAMKADPNADEAAIRAKAEQTVKGERLYEIGFSAISGAMGMVPSTVTISLQLRKTNPPTTREYRANTDHVLEMAESSGKPEDSVNAIAGVIGQQVMGDVPTFAAQELVKKYGTKAVGFLRRVVSTLKDKNSLNAFLQNLSVAANMPNKNTANRLIDAMIKGDAKVTAETVAELGESIAKTMRYPESMATYNANLNRHRIEAIVAEKSTPQAMKPVTDSKAAAVKAEEAAQASAQAAQAAALGLESVTAKYQQLIASGQASPEQQAALMKAQKAAKAEAKRTAKEAAKAGKAAQEAAAEAARIDAEVKTQLYAEAEKQLKEANLKNMIAKRENENERLSVSGVLQDDGTITNEATVKAAAEKAATKDTVRTNDAPATGTENSSSAPVEASQNPVQNPVTGKKTVEQVEAEADDIIAKKFADKTDEEKATVRQTLVDEILTKQLPDVVPGDASKVVGSKENVEFLLKIKKKYGIKIVFDPNELGEAKYNRKTRTLTLNQHHAVGDAMKGVVMHELTHAIEGTKWYDQYAATLLAWAYGKGENADKAVNDAIQKKIKEYADYKENGIAKPVMLTEDGARKEIIAELTRWFVYSDEKSIMALVKEDPGLAKRIAASLGRAYKRVKASFGDVNAKPLLDSQNKFGAALAELEGTIPVEEVDGKFSLPTGMPKGTRIQHNKNGLSALHEAPTDKLLRSLQTFGGINAPSIGVRRKGEVPPEAITYGKVALTFGRSTVDPEVDAANELYDDDAYTPTYPSTVDILNKEAAEALTKRVFAAKAANMKIGAMFFDPTRIPEINPKEVIMNDFYRDDGLFLTFLHETGREIPVVDDNYNYMYLYRNTGGGNHPRTETVADFHKWVNENTAGLYEKGVHDPITGEYYPETSENVVDIMSRQSHKGNIMDAGASARRLSSIEAAKDTAAKLRTLSEKEREKWYGDKLVNSQVDAKKAMLVAAGIDEANVDDVLRGGVTLDANAVEILSDVEEAMALAEAKADYDGDVRDILSDYRDEWDSPDVIKAVWDYVDFRENIPRTYFESKPFRLVRTNEIKRARVPMFEKDGPALAKLLEENGVIVTRYTIREDSEAAYTAWFEDASKDTGDAFSLPAAPDNEVIDGGFISNGRTIMPNYDDIGAQYSQRTHKQSMANIRNFAFQNNIRLEDAIKDFDTYESQVNNIAAEVMKNRDRYDYKPSIKKDKNGKMTEDPEFEGLFEQNYSDKEYGFSAFKKNSDPHYVRSLDFSTMCRKNYLVIGSVEALQKELGRGLKYKEYLVLRDTMEKLGYTVPCEACYVDTRRARLGDAINRYIKKGINAKQFIGKAPSKDYPDMSGFDFQSLHTEEGRTALQQAFPDVYTDLLQYIDKRTAIEAEAQALREVPQRGGAKTMDTFIGEFINRGIGKQKWLTSFVEGRKMNGPLADYPDITGITPDIFLSQEGRIKLMNEHPKVYENFRAYINAQSIKTPENSIEYRNDILRYFTTVAGDKRVKNQRLIDTTNRRSGIRMQSWSDFLTVHMMDMMEATLDLEAMGLKAHAYTKVPAFVRLMGQTGTMINMSLIPKGMGFEADGKTLAFDNIEGMDVQTAKDFRDEFPETAGTTVIGATYENIVALMAADFIDYIIPYHASGKSKEDREATASKKMSGWTDFSPTQRDKVMRSMERIDKGVVVPFEWKDNLSDDPDTNDKLNMAAMKDFANQLDWDTGHGPKVPGTKTDADLFDDFGWDDTISPRQNAVRYAKYCLSMGVMPRFAEFSDQPNYYKVLIDHKVTLNDGVTPLAQRPVVAKFDEAVMLDIMHNDMDSKDTGTFGQTGNYPIAQEAIDLLLPRFRKGISKGDFIQALKPLNDPRADKFDSRLSAVPPLIKLSSSGMDDMGIKAEDVGQFSLPSRKELLAAMDEYYGNPDNLPIPVATGGKRVPPTGDGERQFNNQTAQRSGAVFDEVKKELRDFGLYERQTNREQARRAIERVANEGLDAVIADYLSDEYDAHTADAQVLAAVLAGIARMNGQKVMQNMVLEKHGIIGTDLGQALQARKMFEKLSPMEAVAHTASRAATQLKNETLKWDTFTKTAFKEKVEAVVARAQRHPLGVYSGLLQEYGIENVDEPTFYNRATARQRMRAAVRYASQIKVDPTRLAAQLENISHGRTAATDYDLEYVYNHRDTAKAMKDSGNTGREYQIELARAYEAAANTSQTAWYKKLTSSLRTNMLLNLKTFTRNVLSNVVMKPVDGIAHVIEVGLDVAMYKKYGRTTTFVSRQEYFDAAKSGVKELRDVYRDYFIDHVDTNLGATKYTDRIPRTYQNNFQEFFNNLSAFAMEVGDAGFWRQQFDLSIARQRKLNGSKTVTEEMTERAMYDANYATFKEDNALAQFIEQLRHKSAAGHILTSILIPFSKTPTNLAKRLFDYSPAGVAAAIGKGMIYDGVRGEFDKGKFVHNMARGLTGSGLYVLGIMLKNSNLLSGGNDDEEKDWALQYLKTAEGERPELSITLAGKHYSLSGLQPVPGILAAGAAVAEILGDDDKSWADFLDIIKYSGDSLIEASFLQNINELFNGKSESVFENAYNATAGGLMSQAIPTILKQFTTATDGVKRNANDASVFNEAFKRYVQSNVPGWRQKLPEDVDVAGETIKGWNAFNTFINPLNETTPQNNPRLKEFIRLREANGTEAKVPEDMLRQAINTMPGYDKVLDDDDKVAFKKRFGDLWQFGGTTYDAQGNQYVLEGMDGIMAMDWYKRANDTERLALTNELINNVNAGVKWEFFGPKSKSARTSYVTPSISTPIAISNSDNPTIQRLLTKSRETNNGDYVPAAMPSAFTVSGRDYKLSGTDSERAQRVYESALDRLLEKTNWDDAGRVKEVINAAREEAKKAHFKYSTAMPRFKNTASQAIKDVYAMFDSTYNEDILITPMEESFSTEKTRAKAPQNAEEWDALYYYYEQTLDKRLSRVDMGDPDKVKQAIENAKSDAKDAYYAWLKRHGLR